MRVGMRACLSSGLPLSVIAALLACLVSPARAAGPTVLAPGASFVVADSASDIDLTGNIVYAIDNGSGVDRTVNGVVFRGSQGAAPISGYTQSVANTALGWGSYDTGVTANDDALDAMLGDIQCCDADGNYDFAVANGVYQVQLLFGEKNTDSGNDNTRVWDINTEGLITDDINVNGAINPGGHVHPDAGSNDADGDGSITDQFILYTQQVTVTDGNLDLDLGQFIGGQGDFDRNFVLSATVVELVPEPGGFALLGLGAAALLLRRRRHGGVGARGV